MNIEVAGATVYGPTTPAQQVPGLNPADLQSAYKLPSTTEGSGQTIGLVVVGTDPMCVRTANYSSSKWPPIRV